jgi:hypothetical protein
VIAAASYYCDTLGFENFGFFGTPPVFAMGRRGDVEFFFNQGPDGACHVRPRAAVGCDAYIHVTGLGVLVEEFRRRGQAS